uniref:Uncharacterized protein n=1 Tax=Meloidogyne incognita TaxID=6306 RepID=A0A914NBN4_MELIC
MSTENNIKVVNKNISAERLGLLREECQRLGKMLEEQIQQHYFRCGININFHQQPNNLTNRKALATILKISKPPQLPEKLKEKSPSPLKYSPPPIYQFKRKNNLLNQSPSPSKIFYNFNQFIFPPIQRWHPTVWPTKKKNSPKNKLKNNLINEVKDNVSKTRIVEFPANATIPKPFWFTRRPPIPCIYAERHLHQMMEEKRQEDLQFKLHRFRARSVPISTYRQPNFDWKSKNQRFRTRSLPSRSLTSAACSSSDFALNERKANLHTRSPPLSTYLRPSSCSQSVEELRALRAQRRSVELLSKARGPIGVEEHSIRWRILYKIRHSQQCLAPSRPLSNSFRAQTMPDFVKLQEEFSRKLAANRRFRASTVPRPFHLSERRYNGEIRGHSCESWTRKDREDKRRNMEPERRQERGRKVWR